MELALNVIIAHLWVQWQLLNEFYQQNMLMVPLEGCYIVLGVQWLITLGEMSWNFQTKIVKFFWNDKQQVLRGSSSVMITTLTGKKLVKMTKDGSPVGLLNIQCNALEVENCQNTIPDELSALLASFEDVFVEPKGLPPHRAVDHRIVLKDENKPTCLRPYRYARA